MKQMINQIDLQGYVFNFGGNGLFHNTVNNSKSKMNGIDYINGTVNVATDEDGANVVPVRFNFVTEKYGKSGKENPSWGVLNDIEGGNKTWEVQGKEGAYKIRITCAAGSNPFVGQDGKMVDRPGIEVSFAHPANNGFNENLRNMFKFDIVIINYAVREVEDGDDYGVINGYVFNNFRKEAIPVTLAIRNQGGMNYFEGLEPSTGNPIATQVWGRIVSTTIKRKQEVENAWGDPQVTYTTSTQREWLIDGSRSELYEFGDESFITEDEFMTCLNNHEDVIAAAQKRYDDRQNGKSAFDAPKKVEEKTTKTSVYDFPF